MKTLLVIAFSLFFSVTSLAQENKVILELEPTQSMLISGKGAGQDAAINPYLDQKSIAVVENKGNSAFSVRVQEGDKIIEEIPVNTRAKIQIKLNPGSTMYFDTPAFTKAEVVFKKDGRN